MAGGAGRIGYKGINIGGSKDKAEINITVYLVDSETGQVRASTKVVGTSGKSGLSLGYSGSALGGLTGDLAGFKKDNVGKACEDAIAQSVLFLIEQLESIPWEGSIMSAKAGKIIINRGTREGVAMGDKFSVGEVEQLIDEDTGEVLDEEVEEVARIQVTKVKEKVAYCKALEGGEEIEKSMSVRPIDEE